MTTHPFSSHTRTATVALASAVLLTGAVSGVAAADPPGRDRDPCAVAIAAAGVWPGTMDTRHHQHRLVSDAFDGYLARQLECAPDGADG